MNKVFYFIISVMVFSFLVLPQSFAAPSSDASLWTEDSSLVKIYTEKYKADPIVIISIGQNMSYPDDVSVALYFSKLAHVDPMEIFNLRVKSKKWPDIIAQYKINPKDMFVNLKTDVKTLPDLYRHAYSEYAKYLKDNTYTMDLYDQEIRNLVQLKFCTDHLGMEPGYVIDETAKGTKFTDLIVKGKH